MYNIIKLAIVLIPLIVSYFYQISFTPCLLFCFIAAGSLYFTLNMKETLNVKTQEEIEEEIQHEKALIEFE